MPKVRLFSRLRPGAYSQTPVQARSRRPWSSPLAVLGGVFLSILLLVIALFVGSKLAEQAGNYAFSRSFPEFGPGLLAEANTDKVPASQPEQPVVAREDDNTVAVPTIAFVPERKVNILLLGSDDRVSDREPPRTDTMILLTLDLERKTAGMISLTRDLWLPIPGYNLTTKINTAYALGEERGYPGGGPQLAMDTVSGFIGQPVHYYVQANFNGFVRFIDEIGGVAVDVQQPIYDPEYPTSDFGFQTFQLSAGRHHFDGETALKYARTRNMDSDYGRAARQQQLLQAVANKLLSTDMIPTLLGNAPQLMNTLWGSVSTDMPPAKMAEIAFHVQSGQFEYRQLVLDNRYGTETYSHNKAWILLPNRELIRPALRKFFGPVAVAAGDSDATPLSGSPAQPGAPTPPEIAESGAGQSSPRPIVRVLNARDARLEVLNGTSQYGVAARVRQELQAKGWNVVAIGDADRSDYRRTLLVNYNTDDRLVRELGRLLNLTPSLHAMPGLLKSDSTDLRIVIGQDYLTNASNDSR